MRAYLRKIPDPVVRIVETYQSFAGCDWTPMLRDLSNPDKHKTPTGLAPVVRQVTIKDARPMGDLMAATAHLTSNVRFDQFLAVSVVDWLLAVQREVRALVLDDLAQTIRVVSLTD